LQKAHKAQRNKVKGAKMAKKFKTQTGGLQEKKIKVEPTREEIKADRKAEREKRRAKRLERKKDKVGFIQKIRDMFGELKKVRWPKFNEAVKQTGIVLGLVLVFSIVVFGIDRGLGELYKLLTKGLE
jgi:preprotein translocase subunit SecE